MFIKAINQLQAYQGPYKLTLHPGAGEDLLVAVESAYGVTLPDDFKTLYRFSDGFETDEDIFNMIPLAEIRSNKEGDKDSPLYIAEYMIYSDMWWLEINPDNYNDYKIMVECNSNQLVLTNSLAEFIDRFLKGGVFAPGGLYEWHEEIEALPVYSTKLQTARLLLTVFYYGLRYNIIHEKEVIEWVDRLITLEDEPDPFFIDLSLGHNKNGLIDLLYPVAVSHSSLAARATLGLLHQRLSAGAITISEAVTIIDKHNFSGLLTKTEAQELHYVTNEIWMNESVNNNTKLGERVLGFLCGYKEFEIANYKDWYGFNSRIEYQFRENEENLAIQILREHPGKSYLNTDLIPNAIIYSLALISFVVLITIDPLVESKAPVNSFRSGLYKLSQTFFTIFVCCYLLKGSVWLVKTVVVRVRKVKG
jgi:hypothetical protein